MFAISRRRDLFRASVRAIALIGTGRNPLCSGVQISPSDVSHARIPAVRIALTVPGGVDRGGEYRVIPAILWLIERLARQHDVQVVVPLQEPRAASWELLGAVVHNVVTWPRQLSALRMLLRLHRSSPFDVFHAISASGPGVVACTAAKICRRPVVVHVAGGELVWQPDIAFGRTPPLVAGDDPRCRAARGLRHRGKHCHARTGTRGRSGSAAGDTRR